MKIWKDPYCVDFHHGCIPPPFPHTSERLHTVSLWMGLLIKPPLHTFLVLLAKLILSKNALRLFDFVQENPPIHTHFVSFLFLPPYHTQSYKFYHHYVSTPFFNFSILDPPFHTKFCSSMLLHDHILGKPPPPPREPTKAMYTLFLYPINLM